MTDVIKIDVKDLDKLKRSLDQFPKEAAKYMWGAGQEAAKKIVLPTVGLKKYPPATGANLPPPPFYIRGQGTQTATRGNLGNSERLGTQFTVERYRDTGTAIGNRASYAPFVIGEEQARAMAAIGWRKLPEVAEEKVGEITHVYDKWIEKLLIKVGLK